MTRYLKDGLLFAGIMICALLLGHAPAQAGYATGTVISFTGPATATVGQSLTLTATIQAYAPFFWEHEWVQRARGG